MADIFWGVSDALDLYSEFLQVKKSKDIKVDKKPIKQEKPPNSIPTTTTTEENVENETNEGSQTENKLSITEQENDKGEKGELKTTTKNDKETELNESNMKTPSDVVINSIEVEMDVQVELPPAIDANTNDESTIIFNSENSANNKLETPESTENKEVGAGDAGKPQKAGGTGGDEKLNVETNLEMNFNPTMEPSLNDDIEANNGTTVGGTPEESKENKPPTINILVYGGGDPRHVIKTMAKRYSHLKDEGNACSAPILKFFLIDGCVEIIARNLVLLGIALERPELISLRNKVHLFMDVYGNTLLRPICHQYLVSKSATLLKMVSDKTMLEQMAPFINLDNLKYRELDGLQDTLEFWSPKPGYDFNIKDYWLARLRRLLAVRYDCRDGVFDWDLNMSLKSRGAEQICSQEYKYWRETGIAFTFPEYEQSKPNKTLAAGLVRNGSRYVHRGYIGDIQTGPFCTFGLRSAEERLHHSAHGSNDFRSTEITERNLLEYFYELQNGSPYVHNADISNKYGGVRFHMGERLVYDENDLKGICAYDQPWISVEGIEVHFLSMSEAKQLAKAAGQWENFFDVAFVGYKYFDLLEDTFPKVLRKNGLLILETKLRSTEIKSRITDFEADLLNFARDANLEQAINYNALNIQNSILKFIKN